MQGLPSHWTTRHHRLRNPESHPNKSRIQDAATGPMVLRVCTSNRGPRVRLAMPCARPCQQALRGRSGGAQWHPSCLLRVLHIIERALSQAAHVPQREQRDRRPQRDLPGLDADAATLAGIQQDPAVAACARYDTDREHCQNDRADPDRQSRPQQSSECDAGNAELLTCVTVMMRSGGRVRSFAMTHADVSNDQH